MESVEGQIMQCFTTSIYDADLKMLENEICASLKESLKAGIYFVF